MQRGRGGIAAGIAALALATGAAPSGADEHGAEPVVQRPSDRSDAGEAPEPAAGRVERKPAVVEVTTRVAAESCTREQEEVIETARRAAAIRSQVATDRARGLHPSTGDMDRLEVQQTAYRVIEPDLDFGQVVEISEKMRDRVSSMGLRAACSAKSDPNCAVRSAYVADLAPPIHVCPAFFDTSSAEQRVRTLIHESAHLVGIREKGDGESYCVLFDCDTSCGGFYAADSWAHFVHCAAGQTPDSWDD